MLLYAIIPLLHSKNHQQERAKCYHPAKRPVRPTSINKRAAPPLDIQYVQRRNNQHARTEQPSSSSACAEPITDQGFHFACVPPGATSGLSIRRPLIVWLREGKQRRSGGRGEKGGGRQREENKEEEEEEKGGRGVCWEN